ncbi:hypothetical protein MUY27_10990 [Mucilaginibacter sp. RS28]|uniref:Uncharacterized protein n=1 Tax=Mucilaginibacter straminoryzae TaxID=2932774 RepID=A0A9X1X5Y8_9SPHI|nr:hypothetical protein [Mucilaginibacter straminoryzae]MCJ8210238.1 hypothetical protein [Mucilaginibacter straminoryzae]
MSSVVCTLFEGHYHYGGGALVNSLYKSGFRGDFFIGYKGELPFWARAVTEKVWPSGKISKSVEVAEGLLVHFILIETNYHFTNYKPQFMLLLMSDYANDASGIFYFDPDIVVRCKWEFYENWIQYGITLVHEIVSSDFPPTHPKRFAWQKVINALNLKVERELYHYINAGFCGVSSDRLQFLKTWDEIIKIAMSSFGMDMNYLDNKNDPSNEFHMGDQDALNICAMCCKEPISEIGPEGMDFIGGGWLMSHATGKPKPWKVSFFLQALKGRRASLSEKQFWKNVKYPINLYPKTKVFFKYVDLKVSLIVNRFYSK